MQKFCYFLILLASLALAATANAAGDKWALLIGVDKCKAIGELTVCSADAVAMKSALENIGYPAKHINLLVDNQSDMNAMPTIGNVKRAIKSLAEIAEAGDTVLFFFSGHGVTANGASMLVPTDGDLFDGVSLTWIKGSVRKLQGQGEGHDSRRLPLRGCQRRQRYNTRPQDIGQPRYAALLREGSGLLA
jgi:hypothetical protein